MSNNTVNLKIIIDGKDAVASLRLTDDNIRKLTSSFNTVGENSRSVFSKFGAQMLSVNQAIDVLTRSFQALSKPITIAGNFEQYEVQMGVLLGSTVKAKERIKELSDFANKTPFELPEVVKASKLLQTFGGDAISTGDTLTMVGDMASAAGVGFEEVAMWVGRAYTNIQAGRPFGEAAQRLQELGLMSGDVRKRLEQLQTEGKNGTQVWSAFTSSMDGFNGMMKQQSQTLEGVVSTMRDSFAVVLRDIGVALLPAIKGAAQLFTSISGSISEWNTSMKLLAGGVVALSGAFVLFNLSINPLYYIIGGLIVGMGTLNQGIKDLSPSLVAAGSAVSILAGGIAMLKVKPILNMIKVTNSFTVALAALGTGSTLVLGGIIAGLAVLALSWYKVFNNITLQNESQLKAIRDSSARMTQEIILDIDKLGTLAQKNDLLTSSLNKSKNTMALYYQQLENLLSEGYTLEDQVVKIANARLDAEVARYNALQQHKNTINNIKTINQENIALLSKLIETDEELKKKIAEYDTALKNANLSERERNLLLAERKKLQEALNGEAKDNRSEKEQEELVRAKVFRIGIEKDITLAAITEGEKIALAHGKTEAEKARITKEFALARVQAELEATLKILDLQQQQANQIKDPAKRSVAVNEISEKRTTALTEASIKTETIATDYIITVDANATANAESLKQIKQGIADHDQQVSDEAEARAYSYMDLDNQLLASKTTLAFNLNALAVTTDAREAQRLQGEIQRGQKKISLIEAEKKAKEEAAKQAMLAGAGQYNSEQNLGVQMNRMINERIRAYIADAVIGAMSKMIASMGPLGLIVAPAIGLAVSALLETFIPKFAEGKVGVDRDGIVVGPGGPKDDNILALISPGESITSAERTQEYPRTLQRIKAGTLPYFFEIPNVQGMIAFPTFANGFIPTFADGFIPSLPRIEMPSFAAGVDVRTNESGGAFAGFASRVENKLGEIVKTLTDLELVVDLDDKKLVAIVERRQKLNRLSLI